MRICLVNTNRIKPPISPIGLEYVAEALNAAGHLVSVLDLCWEEHWGTAIARFFKGTDFDLVGVTLRNTDDCAFTGRQSFLGEFAAVVNTIRGQTDAPIILGGVGFSTMPEQVMSICKADAGIWGDGEYAFVELANRIEREQEWSDVPNLILRCDGKWRRNPPSALPLCLPHMSRCWVDNRRYFREGGQIGIETKRGCPRPCIYCADPVAKGRKVRTRPPKDVVDEMEGLLGQGINCFHTCDSEFNVPERHAMEVCREMIKRDLAGKMSWYAYCSPVPFSKELVSLMRGAGCAGINFGVDSGDEGMLRRLKRNFTPRDIASAALLCRGADIPVMFDLLLGSPGETRDSIIRTIGLMNGIGPERVGVSVGVRVYPGTELAELVKKEELRKGLTGGKGSEPLFFLEPQISSFVLELLDELVGDDRRFFFFDPSRPDRNYNYNANKLLSDAISKGYRGAYWDILRRIV